MIFKNSIMIFEQIKEIDNLKKPTTQNRKANHFNHSVLKPNGTEKKQKPKKPKTERFGCPEIERLGFRFGFDKKPHQTEPCSLLSITTRPSPVYDSIECHCKLLAPYTTQYGTTTSSQTMT